MKKVILMILLVVIAGAIYYFYFNSNIFTTPKIENSIGNGTVVEVKDSSVVIQGYLESPTEDKKIITVEFTVDNKTLFKKMVMIVDVEKHSDGRPFRPELSEVSGSLSDLKTGTVINGVKTKDKLENNGTAKALEIIYKGVSFQ